jgi:predicted nucleic acid-binding Zn ribbon protein
MLKRGLDARDGRMGRLGHVVNQYLAEGGSLERSKSGVAAEIWPQVAGNWYAAHSRVIALNGKELKVCCDTPAHAQQLQYDQPVIIKRLNERLGGNYVTSIRAASVGSNRDRDRLDLVIAVEPPLDEAEIAAIVIPPEEQQQARAQAETIASPELRERWLHTALRQIRLRHWKARRGYKPCGQCGVLHNDLTMNCFACRVSGQDHIRQG